MLLTNKELSLLSNDEKTKYYEKIKKECLLHKSISKNSFIRRTFNRITPIVRNYGFEIVGTENIPTNTNCLFVANHSNAHDFFTMQEVFKNIGIDQTFLASNEDLNNLVLSIFKSCGAVLFNRSDKESANKAFMTFAGNLLDGMSGVIYGESTWNLHPYKPMHLIKTGAVYLASIANIPIVPVIYEYVEVPNVCSKEKDIYSKCIVKFGKQIYISQEKDLVSQTDELQTRMEELRINIWKDLGNMRSSTDDINRDVYLNHTYLKKFCGGGEYITDREEKYLLVKDELSSENEYHLNENGLFVPGELSKAEGKKYIK